VQRDICKINLSPSSSQMMYRKPIYTVQWNVSASFSMAMWIISDRQRVTWRVNQFQG